MALAIQPPPTPTHDDAQHHEATSDTKELLETLPPLRRNRNVWIKSAAVEPHIIVAGFWQHGDITASKLLSWLDVVLEVEVDSSANYSSANLNWTLVREDDGARLGRGDDVVVGEGTYALVGSDGEPINVKPVDEKYQPRIFSGIGTPRTLKQSQFRKRVMRRDGQCLITEHPVDFVSGTEEVEEEQLTNVAHLLPVNFESTLFPLETLDSVENGITMLPTEHSCFNSFYFAFDVDDDYRIVHFIRSVHPHLKNATLHLPKHSPRLSPQADSLLREHYRQALLKWVKGDQPDYPLWSALACSFRDETVDLEESQWMNGEGKMVLEGFLASKLHGTDSDCEDEACMGGCDHRTEWLKHRYRPIVPYTPPEPFAFIQRLGPKAAFCGQLDEDISAKSIS